MSAWRREFMARFPELGHEPESWNIYSAIIALSRALEGAARAGDRLTGSRVLAFVLWAETQAKHEESYIYFCQDVLRDVVRNPALRPFLVSLLNQRTFAQISGYVDYLTSKDVLAEMATAVRAARDAV